MLTSTATDSRPRAQLDAYEGNERVFAHTWRLTIPRDLWRRASASSST